VRSEAAIRRHLENLRWAVAQPCGCRATGHARECHQGGMMMTAVIKTLEWALGDNDDIGGQVERMAADRARQS
jgi:hypothetical protein